MEYVLRLCRIISESDAVCAGVVLITIMIMLITHTHTPQTHNMLFLFSKAGHEAESG